MFIPRANVPPMPADDHAPMIRPVTSSKVLLVADRRVPSSPPEATPVRRYRLARLRLDSRPAGSGARFEYLKRVYD
jgi:hypothetical protein